MALLVLVTVLLLLNFEFICASTIELLECDPPDYPEWGGYGQKQEFYFPGDVIHYYCNTDTHIGGNYYRRCEDTGHWSGETPVCDPPTSFSFSNQSSTADPEDQNFAENVVDGERTTCSSTAGRDGDYWFGKLVTPGELIRVMLFLPKVEVAYEVFMVKQNGQELSCGSKRGYIDSYGWEFHNCPGPVNQGIMGVKIKSLSSSPLQICEIIAHVISTPSCVDPRERILNGRLQISRKIASLICDTGYTKSPDERLECIRNGMWNRKHLYCMEREWELDVHRPGENTPRRDPQTFPDRQGMP